MRQLSSSEAALRAAISSARASLQAIEESSLPSPPASAKGSSSPQEDVPQLLHHHDAVVVDMISQEDTSMTVASTTLHDNMEPSSADNLTAWTYRDDFTGLTLELPFGPDSNTFTSPDN